MVSCLNSFLKITELPMWLQIFLRDRAHFITLLHVILSITFSIMKMIQHGTGSNAKSSSEPSQAWGRTNPSPFRRLSDLHFKPLATWTPWPPCTRTALWQYFYFWKIPHESTKHHLHLPVYYLAVLFFLSFLIAIVLAYPAILVIQYFHKNHMHV